MDIVKTLADRGSRYGTFAEQANVTGNIKRAMATGRNWSGLLDDQKEALEMIALKCARILTGDPDFHDSWHDIVGYAKLVADRLVTVSVARTAATAMDHQNERPMTGAYACALVPAPWPERPQPVFSRPWEHQKPEMTQAEVERVAEGLQQATQPQDA